jgi:hypothetical protein
LLDQEDPVIPDLEITGIKFKDNDLSKPLYPSLIDYLRAPAGVQFEPGIQIRSGQRDLTFLFRIDPSSDAVFESDSSDLPVIESIDSPLDSGIAGLVARRLQDPRTCELTWRQSEADALSGGQMKVAALRLRCRRGQSPSDEELVDGGIYLAIINRPEQLPEEVPGADPGLPEPATIQILGTDAAGRPIYDLYRREALAGLPSDLSFEPTFRVREGDLVELSFQFRLAEDVEHEIRFMPVLEHPDQVAIKGYHPSGWPPQVRRSARADQGKKCMLQWLQDLGRMLCTTSNTGVKNQSYCLGGHVTSFMLEAFVGSEVTDPSRVAEKDRRRLIDPTVIQPPSCTSSGICITQ